MHFLVCVDGRWTGTSRAGTGCAWRRPFVNVLYLYSIYILIIALYCVVLVDLVIYFYLFGIFKFLWGRKAAT